MRSRLTTALLVAGLVVFGAGGAYTASAHLGLAKANHGKGHHGKKHAKRHGKHRALGHHKFTTTTQTTTSDEGTNSAQNQYGTRPGKGCGDRNHVHTGPPGNPSNTSCPPQSQHTNTTTTQTSLSGPTAKHHARHHGKRLAKGHGKRHGKGHH
jgi:hypothetical protein